MKEQLVCPVCGYVSDEKHLGEKCPVCGANRSVFKPFGDILSRKRRALLNLHLHPLSVHFPQALSVMIFFLFLLGFVRSLFWQPILQNTVQVMMVLLPVSVLAGMISGLLDGKTRFKRFKGIFLLVKIVLAVAFLIISTAQAMLVLFDVQVGSWLYLLLSTGCLFCSLLLGFIGGKLTCLHVRG